MQRDVKPKLAPFDRAVLAQLAGNDLPALVMAVASFARVLLEQAGLRPNMPLAVDLVALPPVAAGKAAAAIDLLRLLAHSPQGRQALRDLGLEPVLHDIERE